MTRRLLVVPALLAAVAVLSGCALGAGSGPSAEQARDRFYSVLDDVQHTLGGEWENQDDPTPRGCDLALWTKGAAYPGLRIGSMPDGVPVAVQAVRDGLADAGYEIDASEDVGDVVELRARRGSSEVVIFRITDEGMTLQGESECRPK